MGRERERRRKQANLAPSSFVLGQKIGPYRARDRRLSRPHGLRGRIVWEEECVWSWPQNVPLVTFSARCDQTPWRERGTQWCQLDYHCSRFCTFMSYMYQCAGKKRESPIFFQHQRKLHEEEMHWLWLRPYAYYYQKGLLSIKKWDIFAYHPTILHIRYQIALEYP